MTEAFEKGNRRAEVSELEVPDLPLFNSVTYLVTFWKVTGNVRRTKHGVWKTISDDAEKARELAMRWTNSARLGLPVLEGV